MRVTEDVALDLAAGDKVVGIEVLGARPTVFRG
jgi:uncharacterized protein YuzE